MTKNVIVLDEAGNRLSETYPKRAKGLIKCGRAEYVDDYTIKMKTTQDPALFDDYTEETDMSEIISFNTREFRFDKTNEGTNVGSRMFVTDAFGETVEVFEIGNGSDAWTQIACEMVLEKNKDYVFRFASTRKNDVGVSQLIIVPHDEEVVTEDDWENRYVFNLIKGEFKPALNKIVGGKQVKIFEIPFNSYDCEHFRFVFVEQFSVNRIFYAKDPAAYSEYSDADRNIFEETKNQFGQMTKDFDMGQTLSDASAALKAAAGKIATVVSNTTKNVFSSGEEGTKKMFYGHNMDAEEFESILKELNDGSKLGLYGCNLTGDGKIIDCGSIAEKFEVNAMGCNISGQNFFGMVEKIGNGSRINLSGSNIAGYDGNSVPYGGPCDDAIVILTGTNIYESAFAKLVSHMGKGQIEMKDATVIEEYGDFWYGDVKDSLIINFYDATLPEKILEKLKTVLNIPTE